MKNIYLIKDLARITNNSTYTIKYYYKFGLIKEMGRSPHTNFKFFDGKAITRIIKIRNLRKKGKSLSDIKKDFSKKMI